MCHSFQGSATLRCFALTLRSRYTALTPRFTLFIPGLRNASPSRSVRAIRRLLRVHPFHSRAPQRFAALPFTLVRASLFLFPHHLNASNLERETGIEPATNSLEGCDSTTELLPLKFRPLPARSRHGSFAPSSATPSGQQRIQELPW
jgi:hypothetical protein